MKQLSWTVRYSRPGGLRNLSEGLMLPLAPRRWDWTTKRFPSHAFFIRKQSLFSVCVDHFTPAHLYIHLKNIFFIFIRYHPSGSSIWNCTITAYINQTHKTQLKKEENTEMINAYHQLFLIKNEARITKTTKPHAWRFAMTDYDAHSIHWDISIQLVAKLLMVKRELSCWCQTDTSISVLYLN